MSTFGANSSAEAAMQLAAAGPGRSMMMCSPAPIGRLGSGLSKLAPPHSARHTPRRIASAAIA